MYVRAIFINGLFMARKKKLHFVLRFVRNVAALKHFSQHFPQVARSSVSETHRVLHESRLITLLSETIHTILPRITSLTDEYLKFFYSTRITSLEFITSSRFTIFQMSFITH